MVHWRQIVGTGECGSTTTPGAPGADERAVFPGSRMREANRGRAAGPRGSLQRRQSDGLGVRSTTPFEDSSNCTLAVHGCRPLPRRPLSPPPWN